MRIVYENGKVALSKDLVFGLCVYLSRPESPEGQWEPFSSLSEEEKATVRRLADRNPIFKPIEKELYE